MKRSAHRSALALSVVLALVGVAGSSAAFAEEAPKVPEQVAEYFAVDLIPRLIDLYGSDVDGLVGVDFDDTTKIGDVSRVYEWTPEFLAGRSRTNPTRATNNWVAVVNARGGALGLATVWINPSTDEPELAAFDSAGLAMRIAAAPEKALLVHDEAKSAWFALSEDSVASLVDGTSGITGTTTLAAFQRSRTSTEPVAESEFSGVAVSALVLGIVVLGLAIFVLLPVGRRSAKDDIDLDGDDLDGDDLDDDKPDAVKPDEVDAAGEGSSLPAVVSKKEKSVPAGRKPEERAPEKSKAETGKAEKSTVGKPKPQASPKPKLASKSKTSPKPKPASHPTPKAGPKSAVKPTSAKVNSAKANSGASKSGKPAPGKGTPSKPKPRQTGKPQTGKTRRIDDT